MISEHRTFIIAEAGVNHDGELIKAKQLVDIAVAAQADAVKFQSFHADQLVAQNAPKAAYQAKREEAESHWEMLHRLELSDSAHLELAEYCRRRSILFLSTPFDESSVDFLERCGVDRFKVGSGEITNSHFLRYIAKKNRPMLVSTGMATLEEVGEAVAVIRAAGNPDITLLHCVSEYPAPVHEVNLKAMQTMRERFRLPVGLSDHTTGIAVATAAVALGASVIEKHFTIDKTDRGPDHAASLAPEELEDLVRSIRDVEAALGDGVKRPSASESKNVTVVRRSLFAAAPIPEGALIKPDMVTCLRPGDGISAALFDQVMGKRALRRFLAGEKLDWEGLS